MKKYLAGLSLFLIYLSSCKEQIPSGLVLTQTISKDTSYVGTPESAQLKNVLIEELTGAKCPNCPAGALILKDMSTQNPGRIVLSAIHSGFLTGQPPNAIYDFRNADADALRLFFNEGDPSKPSASFDRTVATSGGSVGKIFIEKGATGGDWLAILPTLLAKPTPINIHLTSAYNSTTNKVDVFVKLAFTEDYIGKLAVSLFVLENGRIDKQESNATGTPEIINDYKFDHIFRKLITPAGGELILDSLQTKVRGRVLERTISFEPDLYNQANNVNGIIMDSCVVVAAVHKVGASKEVLHVEEVKLK
jgi:hypothetical protein